jgi:transposase
MQSIAHRYLQLDYEISQLDRHLQRLVTRKAPELMTVKGLGAETVAALLVAASDNPGRLRSEPAFAHLCGITPIPRPPARPAATASTAAEAGRRITPST